MSSAPFRETLWFKRGEFVDVVPGEEAPVPLPIEDRYVDDGTVRGSDSLRFGLHCGQTTEMPLDLDTASEIVAIDGPDLQTIAGELKIGRARTYAAICVSACAVVIVVVIGVL